LKSARERMDIGSALEQVGSYRAAAALCGTTHKTVRRVIEARAAGEPFEAERRPARARNTDGVAGVIAEKGALERRADLGQAVVPVARAAGYVGSARNFRRAVVPRIRRGPSLQASAHDGDTAGERRGPVRICHDGNGGVALGDVQRFTPKLPAPSMGP
jgi:hypothetical protein